MALREGECGGDTEHWALGLLPEAQSLPRWPSQASVWQEYLALSRTWVMRSNLVLG